MYEKIKLNQKVNITLANLRDSLLQRLMNGEINLTEIVI